MDKKLIKAWLRVKLRQVTTAGGIAVGVVWVANLLGFQIPAEYLPIIENIGIGLASLILILMRESGETDAMKNVRDHQIDE